MGHEFKFKESEEGMIKHILLIAISIIMSISIAKAQELNPVNPDIPDLNPKIEQEPIISEWRNINRVIACNNMAIVRSILEEMGQVIYASGMKSPAYAPMDPFDGIIITRNPETFEYAVVIIKTEIQVACILAVGQSFQLVSEMAE